MGFMNMQMMHILQDSAAVKAFGKGLKVTDIYSNLLFFMYFHYSCFRIRD